MPQRRPPEGTLQVPWEVQEAPPPTSNHPDKLFTALRRVVLKPKTGEACKNAWILETTWILVNKRFSECRYPARDQTLIQKLGRAVAVSLKGCQRQQLEETGEEVESLIVADRLRSTVCRRLLGSPSSKSRWIGWTSTNTYHPRGVISLYPLIPSRWMTCYLRKIISSGR